MQGSTKFKIMKHKKMYSYIIYMENENEGQNFLQVESTAKRHSKHRRDLKDASSYSNSMYKSNKTNVVSLSINTKISPEFINQPSLCFNLHKVDNI